MKINPARAITYSLAVLALAVLALFLVRNSEFRMFVGFFFLGGMLMFAIFLLVCWVEQHWYD